MGGVNIKDLGKGAKDGVPSKSDFSLGKLLDHEIKLFAPKFGDKQKESFYLELSTLLQAGLDIKSALELIEEEQSKEQHKEIIGNIKSELIKGLSLWEALRDSGKFTPYEYFSVQIGEETGKVPEVLNQLYNFFSNRLKQQRQFVNALSYPVIILFTSLGAVIFMLLFIVPMFKDVFKRFGGDLPYLTRLIISISGGIQSYFWFFVLVITGVIVYFYFQRKKLWYQKLTSSLIKRVPLIGKIVYAMQLARFCTSMRLLLSAKVSMIRSLDLVGQMVTFYPIQVTLPTVSQNIMEGESLHTSLSRYSVFNRKMVSLLKVGEEVNKLDVFFDKLAKQYESEVEYQTNLLNTFLEPAMIIFLGFIVGFILLAMYLPMFELSTSIGG